MTALDDFITEARAIDLETVFGLVRGSLGTKKNSEYVGPCPACGGTDRFSINFDKGLWHCRQCDGGKGGDGFDLVAQVEGFNLKTRSGLIGVCEVILGRDAPATEERETEEEKAKRQASIEARKRKVEADREKQEEKDNQYRDFAINQGRGFWLNASEAAESPVEAYLKLRTGAKAIPGFVWENLRCSWRASYFDGKDDRGHDIEIHCGPAMVAPMIDLTGRITGCHRTWIDLSRAPKFRPDLGCDAKGDALPTKKMRGHKKGSIIPICGDLDAVRWLGGEGIETVAAVANAEGWREDTFYFATGDIGNMAGPADAKSNFNHPKLTKEGKGGRLLPVKVAGPVPKPNSSADCFQLRGDVRELVLLADGDSEHWMTVSAMARAEARLAREGLTIKVWWPPAGTDFAAIAVAALQEWERAA
jgi:hypothetical protein